MTTETNELIKDVLPALDELIALLEYYDNSTYKAAVSSIAEALSRRGLTAFDDKSLYFDPTRCDVHQEIPREDCTQPYVLKTHVRGYSINGEVIRKSIVDLAVPADA
jgi:molecular chaperone GrpE (heat shock protein)